MNGKDKEREREREREASLVNGEQEWWAQNGGRTICHRWISFSFSSSCCCCWCNLLSSPAAAAKDDDEERRRRKLLSLSTTFRKKSSGGAHYKIGGRLPKPTEQSGSARQFFFAVCSSIAREIRTGATLWGTHKQAKFGLGHFSWKHFCEDFRYRVLEKLLQKKALTKTLIKLKLFKEV